MTRRGAAALIAVAAVCSLGAARPQSTGRSTTIAVTVRVVRACPVVAVPGTTGAPATVRCTGPATPRADIATREPARPEAQASTTVRRLMTINF